MYLDDLYDYISAVKEISVIGREFSAFGREYVLVGLIGYDECKRLVFLEYDSNTSDGENTSDPENMTNRENILSGGNTGKNLPGLLQEVVIDGKSFEIDCIYGEGVLEEADADDVYVLAKFMEKGWESEKFFDYPPECVNLFFAELSETPENLKEFDLTKEIKIIAYETEQNDYPQIKLDLEVEKDINLTVPLFGGEDEICIKRVHLIDFSEVGSTDNELRRICPKGKKIPVIEYTCTNDELGFNISTAKYLDSLCSEAADGFETEDGGMIIFGIQLEKDDDTAKDSAIQQAVPADTKVLECELVSCSKEIENPHIEEFLI